ncbi:DUF2779 domain-containing protein [Azohydromonas caseinilytica]|uniref:DUF2779 domain-containing protein n=1 Tax=Azohydromonas caseinilytica TaxID=2728836 RepID=A0A848F9X0_9BURK|nr:DUF2779 domain-containing protein [Azohydromonas caseinilytica]NML16122.1 DUF2779 domain-containing protein [Azohydromonas caseinilytica]
MAAMLEPIIALAEDDLRRWRACVRRFWLQRHAAPEATYPETEPGVDRIVRGPAATALRASYPGLVTVPTPRTDDEWQQAIDLTERLLVDVRAQSEEGWGVAGACFASDEGVRVRVDLVTRGLQGFKVFRVRHATAGSEADVDAVALWLYVMARNTLRVQSAGLLLIDTSFVYPGLGCYAGLYREMDLAPVLGTRPVGEWIVAMRQCERGAMPALPLGAPCGGPGASGRCEHLAQCGLPPAEPALADARTSLDIVGRELAAELRAEGYADLRGVPLHRLTAARHRRAARAVKHGQPVLDPGAAAALRTLPGPRRWLRFETIGFAVPPWPGTQPYQGLPFQWSCDLETAEGSPRHSGFLAGADGDPRRAFAASLVDAMDEEGPILAYNAGFERNRIRELALRFGDLGPALLALLPRVVDLFALLRDHYYHPAMAGSWSLRSVFQAVAPEVRAHEFEAPYRGRLVHSPLQAYAASLERELPPEEAERLREALRAHGRRHCEALRRLTAVLEAA